MTVRTAQQKGQRILHRGVGFRPLWFHFISFRFYICACYYRLLRDLHRLRTCVPRHCATLVLIKS